MTDPFTWNLAGLHSTSQPVNRKSIADNGPNQLQKGNRLSTLQIFFAQFKSLITWILIATDEISALMGEVVDAVAILAIVVLNAAIGFYQELNAEESIAALKKMSATLTGSDVSIGDRANMVFMATAFVAGTGLAVVVATALQTELGLACCFWHWAPSRCWFWRG